MVESANFLFVGQLEAESLCSCLNINGLDTNRHIIRVNMG
jgi:hypothetical protein